MKKNELNLNSIDYLDLKVIIDQNENNIFNFLRELIL